MLLTCVKAFGLAVPGDTAEVPDGAAFDPEHWESLAAEEPAAPEPEPDADGTPETPPELSALSAPAVFPSAATPTEM